MLLLLHICEGTVEYAEGLKRFNVDSSVDEFHSGHTSCLIHLCHQSTVCVSVDCCVNRVCLCFSGLLCQPCVSVFQWTAVSTACACVSPPRACVLWHRMRLSSSCSVCPMRRQCHGTYLFISSMCTTMHLKVQLH